MSDEEAEAESEEEEESGDEEESGSGEEEESSSGEEVTGLFLDYKNNFGVDVMLLPVILRRLFSGFAK